MKLKRLSASALKMFVSCPRRWQARYDNGFDKSTPELSGSSASLGTACHEAIEIFYNEHATDSPDSWADQGLWPTLLKLYSDAYAENMDDQSRFDEGAQMMKKWFNRQRDFGAKVIGNEYEATIEVQTSQGPVPIIMILDRVEELPDGAIRIIDYKSWVQFTKADEIKDSVQFKTYAAVAGQIWPDAPKIWLVVDALRYDEVGVAYNRSELDEAWDWIAEKAEEIIAMKEPKEVLNSECRYCVRRHECETMQIHSAVTGPESLSEHMTPADIADKRYGLQVGIKAMEAMLEDCDDHLLSHAAVEERLTIEGTNGVTAKVGVRKNRKVDEIGFRNELGPARYSEFLDTFGKVGIKSIERAQETGWGDYTHHITTSLGNPYITAKKTEAVR